jgi:hypothetical protein
MNHKILMKIAILSGLLLALLSHWNDLAALINVLVTLAVDHFWVLYFK